MGVFRIRWFFALLMFGLFLPMKPFVRFSMAETKISAEEIIEERNCRRCHTLLGKGGEVGPDLSEVGARRDAEFIKKKLLNPKSMHPGSAMPPFRGTEAELDILVAYLSSLK